MLQAAFLNKQMQNKHKASSTKNSQDLKVLLLCTQRHDKNQTAESRSTKRETQHGAGFTVMGQFSLLDTFK